MSVTFISDLTICVLHTTHVASVSRRVKNKNFSGEMKKRSRILKESGFSFVSVYFIVFVASDDLL